LVDEISQTAPVDDHALIKEQVHKSEQEIKRLVDENRKMSEDSKIKDAHIAAIEAEKQSRELDLVKDVKMGNVRRQKTIEEKEKDRLEKENKSIERQRIKDKEKEDKRILREKAKLEKRSI
jgi:hypothetical protein